MWMSKAHDNKNSNEFENLDIIGGIDSITDITLHVDSDTNQKTSQSPSHNKLE